MVGYRDPSESWEIEHDSDQVRLDSDQGENRIGANWFRCCHWRLSAGGWMPARGPRRPARGHASPGGPLKFARPSQPCQHVLVWLDARPGLRGRVSVGLGFRGGRRSGLDSDFADWRPGPWSSSRCAVSVCPFGCGSSQWSLCRKCPRSARHRAQSGLEAMPRPGSAACPSTRASGT